MSRPSDRIEELISTLNLNINSFSKECGYSSSATIWRIINDNKKPSKPTLDKICNRFPQVNREWLMTGLGNMLNTPAQSSDDLTLSASLVLIGLKPLMPDLNELNKHMKTLQDFATHYNHVKTFVNDFEQTWLKSLNELEEVKNDIKNINAAITTMKLVKGYEVIKKEQRKSNGNSQ